VAAARGDITSTAADKALQERLAAWEPPAD